MQENMLDAALLETIYEAAGDESKWVDTLAHLAQRMQSAGAMYCVFGKDAPAPSVEAIYTSGYTLGSEQAYAQDHNLADPHVPIGMSTPVRDWFLSHEHFNEKYIARDAFFQEVMNPAGIQWVAGARLWETDEAIACMAFQRATQTRPFGEADRRRLIALTPHLSRATSVHMKLAKHKLDAQLGSAAMNGLNFGIAVVDEARRILFANTTAERLLKHDAVFHPDSARQVTLRHPDCHARFCRALTEAIGFASSTFALLDRHGRPILHATILALPPTSRWNTIWQKPLAMLVLNEPKHSKAFSGDLLQQLYRFTPAEVRLANWLMTGRTMEEYAIEHGLSMETVRTQAKALFAKTDTHRQAELIALLARLPSLTINEVHGG